MTRSPCDFCCGAGCVLHGRCLVPCPVCRPPARRREPVLAPRIAEYLRVFETAWLWTRKEQP